MCCSGFKIAALIDALFDFYRVWGRGISAVTIADAVRQSYITEDGVLNLTAIWPVHRTSRLASRIKKRPPETYQAASCNLKIDPLWSVSVRLHGTIDSGRVRTDDQSPYEGGIP